MHISLKFQFPVHASDDIYVLVWCFFNSSNKENIKMQVESYFVIVLLTIPFGYQLFLLTREFTLGVTPTITHSHVHVTDLPAVSVCFPLELTFKRSEIERKLKRSRDDNYSYEAT